MGRGEVGRPASILFFMVIDHLSKALINDFIDSIVRFSFSDLISLASPSLCPVESKRGSRNLIRASNTQWMESLGIEYSQIHAPPCLFSLGVCHLATGSVSGRRAYDEGLVSLVDGL